MKFILSVIATIALFGIYAEAQRVYVQKLPYYPPPTRAPRPIRVRRQVIGGELKSSPTSGADARLDLTKAIGTPEHNLIGKVFAAGNTEKGPVTTGGVLAYNNNGLGAQLTKIHTPGGIDTFKQSASATLFKDNSNTIAANVFASQNELANGLKFERNGAGLDWNNVNGHSAGITHSNIPGLGQQLGLTGTANLWKSQDRNTRLDLSGTGSQWTSGPLSGQRDFGANLGLTHFFG